MSKSLDLIVGAQQAASITKLENDLKVITPQVKVELQNITVSQSALANIRDQIKTAIESTTYTVGINATGGSKSLFDGTISNNLVNQLKDFQSKLNNNTFVKDLTKLKLPTDKVEAFKTKLQEAKAAYDSIGQSGKTFEGLNIKEFQELFNVFQEIKREYDALRAQGRSSDLVSDATLRKFERIRDTLTQINKEGMRSVDTSLYSNKMTKAGVSTEEQSALISQYNELANKMLTINVDKASEADVRNLITEFQDLNQQMAQATRQTVAPKIADSATISANKLSTRISELMDKYPHLQERMNGAYNQLLNLQSRLGQARTQDDVRQIAKEFTGVEAAIKSAGMATETLGDKIKKRVLSQLGNMAVSYAVMALRKAFRELYTAVSDVDKAMTELKKVTDLTADSYDRFLTRAASQARELGATIDDYVNATADFARLGYNMEDSEMLAKTATVYKNVGDGIENIADASESIISTMKAFNIEAENSMDIVDAFNEVGNNYAISSVGVGEALQRSASAMAAANNTMEETIALAVAGNDVVQDPQKVGTALKTLSMRIRGAKTELEEAGEDTEGMAESVSKLRDEILLLTKNKVDIMLDDKNFKSTYDILREMSKVWNDIADVDQANLLELMGGKRNANVLTSILNNFKDAESVLKTISDDEGSAMKEQEKWLDSIEGKTQQLKAAGQGLSIKLLDSDTVKKTVSGLTKIVDAMSWLAEHKEILTGVFGFFITGKILKNITAIATGLLNIGTSLSGFGKGFVGIFSAIKNVSTNVSASTAAIMRQSAALSANSVASEESATASMGDAAAKKLQAAATQGAAAAASIATVAMAALTVAITAAVIGITVHNKKVQEAKQNLADLGQQYQEQKEEVTSYIDELKRLRKEMDEGGLSESDSAEKKAEILDLQSKIVEKYGSQVRGINLVNGKLDEEIERLEKVNELNAKDYLRDAKASQKTLNSAINVTDQPFKDSKNPTRFGLLDYPTRSGVEDILRERQIADRLYRTQHNSGDIYELLPNANIDAYEYIDALNEIYDYIDKSNDKNKDKVLENISDVITYYKKELKSVDADTYAQNWLIADEDKDTKLGATKNFSASDIYKRFQKDQAQLAAAIEAGDTEAIDKAYTDMLTLKGWMDRNKGELSELDYAVAAWLDNEIRDAVNEVKPDADVQIDLAVKAGKLDETSLEYFKRDVDQFINDMGQFDIDLFSKALGDDDHALNVYAQHIQDTLNILGIDINEFSNTKFANPFTGWADDISNASQGLKNEVGATLLQIEMFGDSSDEVKKKVTSLANRIKEETKDNKDLKSALDSLSSDEQILIWFAKLCGLVDDYNKKTKEAVTDTDNFKTYLQGMQKVGDGLDTLAKLYEDISNGDGFDLSQLYDSKFIDQFSNLDSFEEFVNTLAKYPNNIEKCQSAFNKLAGEYIKDTKILNTVSKSTRNFTIELLKQKGVANAAQIVDAKLGAQEEANTIYTNKLTNATISEANAMIQEANTSKITKVELARLYIQKVNLNKTVIKTADDIKNLKDLANTAYATADSLERIQQAEDFFNRASKASKNGEYGRAAAYKKQGRALLDDIQYEDDIDLFSNLSYTGDAGGSGGSSGSGGGGSGTDEYLENWKKRVEDQKKLVEEDKKTQEQYYEWLEENLYKSGGLAANASLEDKYADEIRDIKLELYEWEKESIQKKIDEQDALLRNQKAQGLIDEVEYNKKLAKIEEEGYQELLNKIQNEKLFGVDEEERLNAETELLDAIREKHNAAYNAEIKELEHLRSMNLITDEQYFAKHTALVKEYYANNKMYAEEFKEEQEKLWKESTDLAKKYSNAAKDAISSIMNISKSVVDALGDLVEGIIDANSSNFDLQKKQLEHQLKMNYITEKEYYDKLESLYKMYYKSKAIYLDEYWENQEEIYQYELDSMSDNASAIEDLHAKVVDMIRDELEDAKKAIDETKEKYNDLIDIRRKALEEEKEENDTEKSRAEKLNEIAELTRQLNALRNDNSAEGQRKYKEILSKLIKARKDLADFEEEQAYKAAQKQLENEQDANEKKAEAETKALDDKLDDNEWLVSEAWARMTGMPEELYNQLIEWQHKTSTSIKNDIIEPFEQAREAIQGSTDDVKELYTTISEKLLHPENYYNGHGLDKLVPTGEVDEYGNPIMVPAGQLRKEETDYDANLVKQKELENYMKVLAEFTNTMAGIMGDSAQDVAKIINELFPNPVTEMLVDGADMLASTLGIAGINASLISTVAELGGIAGIMDMMSGFQDLAEGKEGSGVAVGGETMDNIYDVLKSIESYQRSVIGSQALGNVITSVINAIGQGPTDGSSVVTGITLIGTSLSAIVALGTLLAGGGGTGFASLLGAISSIGSLFGGNLDVNIDNGNRLNNLIIILTKVCEWTGKILNTNESTFGEMSGLRTMLYNGWRNIYNLINNLISGIGTSSVLGGMSGGLSALSSASGTLLTEGSGFTSILSGGLSGSLGENLIKVLSGSGSLLTDAITKSIKIASTTVPTISNSGDKNVSVSPVFQINSSDPEGVANEILKLMPKIADYTISAMIDSAGNQGVKRSALSLV